MADRRATGLSLILVATAGAGLGGYAITTIVARGLGPREYATFAVFWAALYFVVGSLSGIQQETTRASRPALSRDTRLLFGVVGGAAAIVAATLAVVLGVVNGRLFPGEGWMLALPLLVGPIASVGVAAITGVLYGVAAWRMLSVVIVADVALRLVGILAVLLLHGGIVEVAWAAIVPLVLVAAGLSTLIWRRGTPGFALDSTRSRLAANIVRTVGGGLGISLLVSGFPLFIKLFSGDERADSVGVLVYALTLTRAPLVVSVLALQSYLVVFLRDHEGRLARTLVLVLAAVLGGGALLAVVALVAGAPLVQLLAGGGFGIPSTTLALLVLVSVVTASLAVTGSAVLARGFHGAYVAGWTVAAFLAVALLAVPGDLTVRVIVALAVGPVAGVVVHLVALRPRHVASSM